MKRFRALINKSSRGSLALLLAFAQFVPALALPARANADGNHQEVTICHATGSESNPFNKITVDDDAVDGDGGNDHNADNHQNGEDIIPPGAWDADGRNWDATGQVIWNNDCETTRVEVKKVVAPTNDPGLFNLKVEGVTKAFNVGNGGTTEEVYIHENENITVSETQGTGTSSSNYTASIVCKNENGNGEIVKSGEATSVTIDKSKIKNGDDIVCIVTNTRKDSNTGTLKVVKDVVNDNKGTKTAADFTFKVNGGAAQNFTPTTGPDGEAILTLPAGFYTVTEVEANQNGYNTFSNCTSVLVVAKQTVTCTITNNDDPNAGITGSIKGFKFHDLNKNGQHEENEPKLPGWTINLVQKDVIATAVTDENGWYEFKDLGPYEYIVCEVQQPGWVQITPDPIMEGCAFVSVYEDGGGVKYLNFGNYQERQAETSVTVNKKTWPWVHSQNFDFDLSANGNSVEQFTLDTDNNDNDNFSDSQTISGNFSGVIELNEESVEGWIQEGIDCFVANGEVWKNVGYPFTAEAGKAYKCDVYNTQLGTLEVTKFNDINENGFWDEGEPELPNWGINIVRDECKDSKTRGSLDVPGFCDDPYDGTQHLSAVTGEDGRAVFSGLYPDSYTVSEDQQDGWAFSNIYCYNEDFNELSTPILSGDTPEVYSGDTTHCFIGNHREARFTLAKTNNQPNPVAPGTNVVYTLTITVPTDSGNIYGQGCELIEFSILDLSEDECGDPILVTDLPPENFVYQPGSWTAFSNIRGDLKAVGTTPEPTYASPGQWSLGNLLVPGEVVTLSYIATISSTVSAGQYPDGAFAQGFSSFGDPIFANSVSAPFVGSKVDVKLPTEQTPAVLGATTLSNTGDGAIIKVVLGIGLVGIAILVAFGGKKKLTKGAKIVAIVVSATGIFFVTATSASAASPTTVNIQKLDSPNTQTSFRLNYQVLTVNPDSDFSVNLLQNGSVVSSQTVTHSYGDSGAFDIALVEDGSYNYQVVATVANGEDAGTSFMSEVVNYQLDRVSPSSPTIDGVTREGNTYTIKFTVPADSDAKTVEIFAATTSSFTLSADKKIATLDVTPGIQQTFVYTAPDSTDRFFAIVTRDGAGNVSAPVGDQNVTNVTPSDTSSTQTTVPGVEGADTDDQEASNGEDQAAGDDEASTNPWWYVLLGIIVIVGGAYGYQRWQHANAATATTTPAKKPTRTKKK